MKLERYIMKFHEIKIEKIKNEKAHLDLSQEATVKNNLKESDEKLRKFIV